MDTGRQNRVSPWEIELTNSISGHNSLLAPGSKRTKLSLPMVDPDFPNVIKEGEALTTSSVPPQDIKWLHRALDDNLPIKIPTEVVDNIVDHVDWLMSEEEYKQCAVKMRKEREAFWQTHDQLWFSIPFSVWNTF